MGFLTNFEQRMGDDYFDNPAGSPTQGPALSTGTPAPQTAVPAQTSGTPAPAGVPAPIEGQGFNEEYWTQLLTGGMGGTGQGVPQSGNVFGAGPGANKDLEAILLREGVPELDAQTMAAFVAAREAQMQQAQGVFTTERDTLLEDLFGRNMQRSTVAGEAGGRMLEGQARTLAGIEAQDMMARLQQQNVMADRLQKGAAAAGDTRSRYRAAQASENAAASQANATRAMASAQLQAAELSARSRMATAMAEMDLKRELGLGDLALRGDELALKRNQLDFSYWAKEGDWASGIAMIQESEPSWWESVLGFAGAALPFDDWLT